MNNLDSSRPFVDYYAKNNISPVQQNIEDQARHFERRTSLYRLLGIPALAVRERNVLEFGPGSGHNSLHTASLRPRRYVLVDANPRGIEETRLRLAGVQEETSIEVVDSLVEDFVSDTRFDIVLAENLVPFQRNPSAFVKRIASFVAPDGILVVTCIDAVSHLAEIGRRIIAHRIAPPTLPLGERVSRLRLIFASHVATLSAMSRSLDDWILDNLTHPLIGTTFSIPEAIAALDFQFDVMGSSPSFLVEWRWYKELYGNARGVNAKMDQAYYENVVNILDCRHTMASINPKIGHDIVLRCDALFGMMQAYEAGADGNLDSIVEELTAMHTLLQPIAPLTAASIEELGTILSAPIDVPPSATAFPSFFGRGTQYLSFVRR